MHWRSVRYLQLEAELSKLGVGDSSGAAGRVSSFEVTVDGHLVYSKLAKGIFPDMKALARQVRAYSYNVVELCRIQARV